MKKRTRKRKTKTKKREKKRKKIVEFLGKETFLTAQRALEEAVKLRKAGYKVKRRKYTIYVSREY